MKTKFLILLICFLAFSFNTATAQTYDPYAVQLINNLIANNGLQATPNAPETWINIALWNDETPKQLTHFIAPEYGGVTGEISFTGLQSLIHFNCSLNSITKLDLSNNPQLLRAWAHNNQLTEINLTNCNQLQQLRLEYNKLTKLDSPNSNQITFFYCARNNLSELNLSNCKYFKEIFCYGNNLTNIDLTGLVIEKLLGNDQSVSLSLIKNETTEYTCPILLNSPIFEHSTISYWDGILKSTDNNVWNTKFTVQTNKEGCELSGTMRFTYSDVGIITPQKKEKIKVYPNPATNTFFVECDDFNTAKLYDMLGREMLSQNGNNKTEINISHLPNGIYIVALFSEGKLMGNSKIIKQ